MDEELDFTKLKYVLYARKSEDDPQKQIRSIGDQIAECRSLAIRLGLHIIEPPLVESKSAKKPNQRPVFSQMLQDIRVGKYDAILAWNPDRLARNMKEGGEIIDMVDEKVIKDLKFVTHHFSSDPNGKMLLGMAFVLSKQYSDKLSVDVTRGVRLKFGEGRSHIPKHGYTFDDNGIYHPDGKNFDLMREAWEARLQGTSLDEISMRINKKGYSKTVKSSGRQIQMNAKILTDIFHDPFYYGILALKSGQMCDLRAAYKFVPMITEDEYNQVQELSRRRLKPFNTKRHVFYPLKAIIICSFCGKNMVVGPPTGHMGKRYLNYRCDNGSCNRPKRSIRAKYIFNYIYKILERGLRFTEDDYNNYYSNFTDIAANDRQKLMINIHSLEGSLKAVSGEIKQRSLDLVSMGNRINATVRRANDDRISELNNQKENLESEITALKAKIRNPEDERLSLEQFLNLSKKAAATVKYGSPVTKDAICRLIFLNLTAGVDKMLSYQAKPPFDEMLKVYPIVSGADERI